MKELVQYLEQLVELQQRVRQLNDSPSFNYVCAEDFILDRGYRPTSEALTEEQYEYLMQCVGFAIRQSFPYKQCFFNSQILVLADFDDRLKYIEGYCKGPSGFPVHHGWLELDGKVVDVTFSNSDRGIEEEPPADLKDRVLGEIPEGWIYYGVQFESSEVADFIHEHHYSDHLIANYRQFEKTLNLPRLREGA